jgi:acetyl esterase/lipase
VATASYGPHGRRNLLDVYRGRNQTPGAPLLIHLHGGGFRSGRKSFYSRALLHEFARQGWVCISASYRLRPRAGFHEFMVDVKRAVVWARENAREHGADPACIVLAGSSAGAHLALTAALTQNEAGFQPGFENADTSVAAAIGLYGYYGRIEPGPEASSPAEFAHPHAPPLLIAHGAQDTFVPPEPARRTAARLRVRSANPVVYAELPGAQHSFDLVHSLRFEMLIDALLQFTAWVRSSPETTAPTPPLRPRRHR